MLDKIFLSFVYLTLNIFIESIKRIIWSAWEKWTTHTFILKIFSEKFHYAFLMRKLIFDCLLG